MTLLPSKIKVWPQGKPTNWPQILERFVEKEKNVAQIKNLSGVRKSIQISQNLTKWSEGYHWNQLVELVILIPNSIFHVKVSCQSTRPIRYGNNDTLTRCKSIITKLAHICTLMFKEKNSTMHELIRHYARSVYSLLQKISKFKRLFLQKMLIIHL